MFERLDELLEETGRALVHPFDDPLAIAGQGTVGLEILEDVPGVDTIVVPIGGGGLISGIAAAASGPTSRSWPSSRSARPRCTRRSRRASGCEVDARSVADGLNAPYAGRTRLAIARQLGGRSSSSREEEIAEGFRFLYERAKLACEPAGAAAVAALLAGKVDGRPNVCVVSGGNVAAETAAGILASP